MHYPDSRWLPRCQGKSRDDVSGRIHYNELYWNRKVVLDFWMCVCNGWWWGGGGGW